MTFAAPTLSATCPRTLAPGLGLGYGPLATGLRLLPWTATPMIVAPLAGTLADRIGARPLLVTGLALQAGGLAWFAAIASAAGGYGKFVAPLISPAPADNGPGQMDLTSYGSGR